MGQSSALFNEAQESLQSGDWDQAIGKLEALKQVDDSAEVFENLAKAFALRGRYLSVLSIYLEWARCELDRGELERAEAALGYAHKLDPASHAAHRLRVELTRARGDSARLVEELQELAFLALEQGECDSSAEYMREAMEVDPANIDLGVQMAELYVSLGQIPAAVKEYRKAINRYKEAGRVKDSLRPLRGLKLLSSDDVALFLELGDTCLALGAVDEAEEQYRAVLKTDLEHRDALLKLGQVCHRKGLFRNGILALSKVIQLEPSHAEAHRWLGEIVAVSKEPAAALEHFHRAASLYLELGAAQQAADVYQRLLAFEPEDAEALNGLMSLGVEPIPHSEAPEAVMEDRSEESLEPPTADTVSAAFETPESGPEGMLSESAETTVQSKRFVRPAMVRKAEYAKPTAATGKARNVRRGLIARDQEPSQGKFGGKRELKKPMFPMQPAPESGMELELEQERGAAPELERTSQHPVKPQAETASGPEVGHGLGVEAEGESSVEPPRVDPSPVSASGEMVEPVGGEMPELVADEMSARSPQETPDLMDDLPTLEELFADADAVADGEAIEEPSEPAHASASEEQATGKEPTESPVRIDSRHESLESDLFEGWELLQESVDESDEKEPQPQETAVEAVDLEAMGWSLRDSEEVDEDIPVELDLRRIHEEKMEPVAEEVRTERPVSAVENDLAAGSELFPAGELDFVDAGVEETAGKIDFGDAGSEEPAGELNFGHAGLVGSSQDVEFELDFDDILKEAGESLAFEPLSAEPRDLEPLVHGREYMECESECEPLKLFVEIPFDDAADQPADDFPLSWDELWTEPEPCLEQQDCDGFEGSREGQLAGKPPIARALPINEELALTEESPLDEGLTPAEEQPPDGEQSIAEQPTPANEQPIVKQPTPAMEPSIVEELPLTVEIPLPIEEAQAQEPPAQVAQALSEELSDLLSSTLPIVETALAEGTPEPPELDRPILSPVEPASEESAESDELLDGEGSSPLWDTDFHHSEATEVETCGEQQSRQALNINELRQRLLDCPTHEGTLQRLGDMCLQFGLLKEALAHYRALEEITPGSVDSTSRVVKAALWLEDHPTVIEGLWRVAEMHFRRAQLEKCQDALGSLLALQPEHKPARQMLVDVFMACGQEKIAAWHLGQMADRWMAEQEYDHAAQALERLISVTDESYAKERLAKLYDFRGHLGRAQELYRELRGRFEREERWDKALECAELLVASRDYRPDDAEYLLDLYGKLGMTDKVLAEKRRLAESLREKGQPRRAVELLQDVLAAHPGELATERLLVELYLESGELALAEPHADTMAERFLREKSYTEATELFELWVRVAPTSTRVRERLAQFYQLSGDLDGAKLEWLLVSEEHQVQGDLERAARSLERALELAPEELKWRLRLARLRVEQLQDPEGALQEFRALFKLAPTWEEGTRLYLQLLLESRLFEELGQALALLDCQDEGADLERQLLENLQASLEANPADLELQLGLAEIYYAQGSLDRAIELFQKLRRIKKYELRAYRFLGCCFAKKSGFNMRELALSQFRKGLSLADQEPEEGKRLRHDMAALLEEMGRATEAQELRRP